MKTGDCGMELTNEELKNRIIEDGIRCCKKDEYLRIEMKRGDII